MSESTSEPATATPKSPSTVRRPALRFVVGVLLGCLILFGWYYIRGTWATKNPKNPSSPEEGITSVIVQDEEGDKGIHTAVVLPVSVEDAWEILSDYGEWEKLFTTIRDSKTEKLDENRYHIVSDVMTPLGTIKIETIVTHEETPDGGHLAWWDAPTDELPLNRGSIRVTPIGPEQTLLVYTVLKEYRKYPQFVVYNMLLGHQKDLVGTLSERIIEAADEP